MKKQAKITRQTMIADAVKLNPMAPQIMFSYGLHCIGCHVSLYESIEQGCMGHGMDDKQIDKMVDELNKTKSIKKIKSIKGKK